MLGFESALTFSTNLPHVDVTVMCSSLCEAGSVAPVPSWGCFQYSPLSHIRTTFSLLLGVTMSWRMFLLHLLAVLSGPILSAVLTYLKSAGLWWHGHGVLVPCLWGLQYRREAGCWVSRGGEQLLPGRVSALPRVTPGWLPLLRNVLPPTAR